jgi:hypothetical protein
MGLKEVTDDREPDPRPASGPLQVMHSSAARSRLPIGMEVSTPRISFSKSARLMLLGRELSRQLAKDGTAAARSRWIRPCRRRNRRKDRREEASTCPLEGWH